MQKGFRGIRTVKDFVDQAKEDHIEPCLMVNLKTGEIQPYIHVNNHLFRCVAEYNYGFNPDDPETGTPFYIDDIVCKYTVKGEPNRKKMHFFGLNRVLIYEPQFPKNIDHLVFFIPKAKTKKE